MLKIKYIFQKIKFINNIYTRYKWREKRVSYGKDNPDKIFYVIRRAKCECGLFSYVTTMIGGIKVALDKGYIPIIDMQNEINTYLDEDKVGIANSWEYYFKQPAGYSLEDISNSKNIILGNGIPEGNYNYPDKNVGWNEKDYLIWHDVCKNYLFLNDDLLAKYENRNKEILENKSILGVLARGTDYVTQRPKDHPIQPQISQIMLKIDEQLVTNKYEFIYLATEDKDIYTVLKEKYKDILLSPNVKRYEKSEVSNINRIAEKRIDDRRLKGEEYLEAIWILSKCKGLIAGNVSGSIGALLLNDIYEYKYIFNLGLY